MTDGLDLIIGVTHNSDQNVVEDQLDHESAKKEKYPDEIYIRTVEIVSFVVPHTSRVGIYGSHDHTIFTTLINEALIRECSVHLNDIECI